MEFRWLKRAGASEAVVVFGGWAVGPGSFGHLDGSEDVLFASDYRDLDADLPDISAYRRVSLLAWSFGVASYAHWQLERPDPFARKTGVNGSLTPVNRKTGIPPEAFKKTLENLNPAAYQMFLTRVFGSRQPVAEIDIEARQAELLAVEARGEAPPVRFGRIWIGSQDKIFPPANLARAWEGHAVRHVDAPHAPFRRFQTWEGLLA